MVKNLEIERYIGEERNQGLELQKGKGKRRKFIVRMKKNIVINCDLFYVIL